MVVRIMMVNVTILNQIPVVVSIIVAREFIMHNIVRVLTITFIIVVCFLLSVMAIIAVSINSLTILMILFIVSLVLRSQAVGRFV